MLGLLGPIMGPALACAVTPPYLEGVCPPSSSLSSIATSSVKPSQSPDFPKPCTSLTCHGIYMLPYWPQYWSSPGSRLCHVCL